jgi:hypothetical protein
MVAGPAAPRKLDVGLSPTGDWRIEFDESAGQAPAVADEPDTAEEAEHEPEQFAEA